MTYKTKFIVLFTITVVAAYALLQESSLLSGGDTSALVPFIVAFVAFGFVSPAAYYFWSRMRNVSKGEQQLLSEVKTEMNAKNGEKK